MKLNQIMVSNETFGKDMILVSQNPYFSYVDGKRTDDKEGYKYEVVLVNRGFEKVSVKVKSQEQIFSDAEVDNNIKVGFEGLDIRLYQDFKTSQVKLPCNATSIFKLEI